MLAHLRIWASPMSAKSVYTEDGYGTLELMPRAAGIDFGEELMLGLKMTFLLE